MAQNNFKPFATGAGANVSSQLEYEGMVALSAGFTAGVARSAQINKAIRQATFIAAALAQYTADKGGEDILDDGDLAGFVSKMAAAFGKEFQPLSEALTVLAELNPAADRLPYFTGNEAASLTALTSIGRDVISKNTVAELITYLGLNTLYQKKNTASLNVNGWHLDSSTGLITQWGTYIGSGTAEGNISGTDTVNLPIPFPSSFLWCSGWVSSAVPYQEDECSNSAGKNGASLSSIRVTYDKSIPTAWIARGY